MRLRQADTGGRQGLSLAPWGGESATVDPTKPEGAVMSTADVQSSDAGTLADVAYVDLKLEAVVIPVSDVDRTKEFYGNLGWRLDADFPFDNGFRVVQFTP